MCWSPGEETLSDPGAGGCGVVMSTWGLHLGHQPYWARTSWRKRGARSLCVKTPQTASRWDGAGISLWFLSGAFPLRADTQQVFELRHLEAL